MATVIRPTLNLEPSNNEQLLTREWLVTNGLGGYASGTVSNVATRRYHGLLIAALPAPFGRTLMLAHLSEQIRLADNDVVRLGGEEDSAGTLQLYGAEYLTDFWLEMGLPVWRYEIQGAVIEKRIVMPHEQNTVHVNYRLVEGEGPVRLKLMPMVHARSHDAHVNTPLPLPFTLKCVEDRFELQANNELPPLRLQVVGHESAFTMEPRTANEWLYRVEQRRGYAATGRLWRPGYFRITLDHDQPATLIASTESWQSIDVLDPSEAAEMERHRRQRLLTRARPEASRGFGAELVLAADQFLIRPAGRVRDATQAHAAGDDVRTVIAGYHWFTDWGRDTMISLEGLTLMTGRHAEAGYLLRTFAQYVRDGLIPNLFPEGGNDGLYHTADATLWYFHALDRYLQTTKDQATLEILLPKLVDIYEHHLRGTRFGIGVDPQDGLLRQGAAGYQLTWMDAKVDDWVVTPRRGKAVEINALWYNAVCLLADWLRELRGDSAARPLVQQAEQTRQSFNQRFWNESAGCLYDIVDGEGGDDPAIRPNQLFAISLKHAVLDSARWDAVVSICRDRLLTPMGLRSLAPGHPDYKPRYDGDLRSRDAAYHQGTVWGWLIGPFIDAWLKTHPEDGEAARAFLEGFQDHMQEACVGSISEIFDAEAPYYPRGCAAQAWSVAEVLRCWVATNPTD
ncbi:MAG: glycogen debranching enzyme family protein [Planctomycetales bacterium]|nr:glycogen debranching enzyme family protein [Planctomycetales bacterium]